MTQGMELHGSQTATNRASSNHVTRNFVIVQTLTNSNHLTRFKVIYPCRDTMANTKYEATLALIDQAHAQDPRKIVIDGHSEPFELHYSQKMSHYLEKRLPNPPDTLRLAIRAQHLRRWEVPRNSYAMNKQGYYGWRTYLKKRQADVARQMCLESGYSTEDAERVAALIRKENLKKDEETQVLEDVACLVFLDEQFVEFEKLHDEEKIIDILRKTWVKMSERGHELALEISISERAKSLVMKALSPS
jgi:hypothetical protein